MSAKNAINISRFKDNVEKFKVIFKTFFFCKKSILDKKA